MTTLRARTHRAAGRRRPASLPYINRELSWLDFNARVLHEARDERNPFLERAKFLAIFASNLDEFFQVRVSGLMEQIAAGGLRRSPDGRTAAEQLALLRERVRGLIVEHSRVFGEVRASLAHSGIAIVDHAAIPEHHARLRERYLDEIFPVLTPLAVASGHPFPYISALSLSLAITVADPLTGEERFARVKIPPILPRLVEVERRVLVPLEQIIAANLDTLFPGMQIVQAHPFRVTRDADFDVEEDEAGDLLSAIEQELRRRRFGFAVRLEVDEGMPAAMREFLLAGVGLDADDLYEVPGMLDLTCLWQVATLELPELRDPSWAPVVPPRLVPADEDEPVDVFAAMRAGDILVHHPYESFTASVERFITQAADDPDVLSIKQTLYRTSGDSPVVRDLIRAAEQGKQVVVLVEIKARFDEEANIVWARKLEQAGAHVVYGLVGLKTHSKVALVVRRETGGLRRYLHLGTGNYNPKTARVYTDLGLLTCRPELSADATDLFNFLTGLSRQQSFRRLLVAPVTLRPRIRDLIEREADHARAGRPARILVKVNALVDPEMIEHLYDANEAGVEIDCIVRAACSLHPGLPGRSERIRVRSIIGQFLEHSRIYGFANGGRQEWYTGSADLMERNLDRRVEVIFPVEDLAARARIEEIISAMLADDRRSWQLGADATWRRTEEIRSAPGSHDTFATLKERALAAAAAAAEPPAPGPRFRSLDPRA
jgi:polyphosphate kinase